MAAVRRPVSSSIAGLVSESFAQHEEKTLPQIKRIAYWGDYLLSAFVIEKGERPFFN